MRSMNQIGKISLFAPTPHSLSMFFSNHVSVFHTALITTSVEECAEFYSTWMMAKIRSSSAANHSRKGTNHDIS